MAEIPGTQKLESKRGFMNRRSVVTTMALVASLFAGEAVYAQPAAFHAPVNAMFSHVKTVSFSMRNDSSTPIKVRAGDQEMTLDPGKSRDLKLPVGEKVVAVETAGNYQAGAVLAVAGSQLSDSTIVLR
jgi:hypothetical protein